MAPGVVRASQHLPSPPFVFVLFDRLFFNMFRSVVLKSNTIANFDELKFLRPK